MSDGKQQSAPMLSRSTKDGIIWIGAATVSLAISAHIVTAVYEPAPIPIGETATADPGLVLTSMGLLAWFAIVTMLGIAKVLE